MESLSSLYHIDASACRRIVFRDRRFYVFFGYDPALLPHVRRLPDRHYDPDAKVWWVPARPSTVAPLRTFAIMFGFDVSGAEPTLTELEHQRAEKQARLVESFRSRDWTGLEFSSEREEQALRNFQRGQQRDHYLLKRHGSQDRPVERVAS